MLLPPRTVRTDGGRTRVLTAAASAPAAARSPDDALSFRLLGPVRARRAGVEIDLGTPQQRAVLAMLLLADGHPVPVDEAVDRLWGDDAPRSARGVLRTYIYRLRRALQEPGGADPIEFAAGAYRMRRTGYRLDVAEFDALLRAGTTARAGDEAAARTALRAGLRLWRGEALQGVDAAWLDSQREWLESRRLDAVLALLPLELAGGDAGGLLHEVAELRRRLPTHERLAELQMTGLLAKGDRTGALAVYDEVRRTLADELGVDPGPDLQALHLRVLRSERTAPSTAAAAAVERRRAPDELPDDGRVLVGRRREIEAMTAALTGPAPQHVGVAGLGGMGKTALAVHVARAVRGAFPDGRLFVRVGTTPAAAVLHRLLTALGVRAEDVGPTVEERVALWRTLTAELRLLVVLDDVATGRDLPLLLPAGGRSAAVLTAERRILDLPRVRWSRLGPLTTEEAVEVLGGLAGRRRVAAEGAAARRLVEECSSIPLAVEVAAARLRDRPSWSIADLEQELLEDLASPVVMQEDCAIVDAPLARAEAGLTAGALAAFHVLAAAADGGEPFAREDAADRLALDQHAATGLLEELVDANLLVPAAGRRYRYLTLVAAYARRQAPPEARRPSAGERRPGVDTASTPPRSTGRRPLLVQEERLEEGHR